MTLNGEKSINHVQKDIIDHKQRKDQEHLDEKQRKCHWLFPSYLQLSKIANILWIFSSKNRRKTFNILIWTTITMPRLWNCVFYNYFHCKFVKHNNLLMKHNFRLVLNWFPCWRTSPLASPARTRTLDISWVTISHQLMLPSLLIQRGITTIRYLNLTLP